MIEFKGIIYPFAGARSLARAPRSVSVVARTVRVRRQAPVPYLCRDIHCESSYTVYGYPHWITVLLVYGLDHRLLAEEAVLRSTISHTKLTFLSIKLTFLSIKLQSGQTTQWALPMDIH